MPRQIFPMSDNKKISQFLNWFFVELVFPLSIPIFAFCVLWIVSFFLVFEKVDHWGEMLNKVIFGGTYTFYGIILTFSIFLKYLDCKLPKEVLLFIFILVGFFILLTGVAFVANIGAAQAKDDAVAHLTIGLISICILFSIISKIYFLNRKP